MDLYRYRRRLGAENSSESIIKTTKNIINNSFHDTPNYRVVYLNGKKVDARMNFGLDGNEREFVFRPNTAIEKGDIIELDSVHWLAVDKQDDEIYPTVEVEMCNEWLRWEENGQLFVYPAVVSEKAMKIDEGKYVITAESALDILTPYNEDTERIHMKQRFIFNDKAYEVEGIDSLTNVAFGKGFLKIEANQTLIADNDNIEEDVADNTGSGWGEW